ncbi:MAG: PorT family protein [Bacteroides sp.]|nr:PorT family protein [Bacteroides sp.]
MRRIIGLFIAIALALSSIQCATAACPADSGRVVSGGIKAEANSFAYKMTVPPEVAKTIPGTGFSVGGFVFFNLHRHIALQIDVFYHFKTASVEQQGNKGHLTYLGMEIPFYVMAQWKFGNCSRLYVGTGPNVEFGYHAVIKSHGEKFDLYKKDEETELSAMQNTSMGWALMAGYEFAFGLQLNVAFKGGFYNVLDANRTEVGCYPITLSAGVAYRFGLLPAKNKDKDAE